MSPKQVLHELLKVLEHDLVVAVFIEFFHGFFDILTRYNLISLLSLEQCRHFLVADEAVPVFIVFIKCLFDIVIVYKHVEIDTAHKEFVKVELVASINVSAFQ